MPGCDPERRLDEKYDIDDKLGADTNKGGGGAGGRDGGRSGTATADDTDFSKESDAGGALAWSRGFLSSGSMSAPTERENLNRFRERNMTSKMEFPGTAMIFELERHASQLLTFADGSAWRCPRSLFCGATSLNFSYRLFPHCCGVREIRVSLPHHSCVVYVLFVSRCCCCVRVAFFSLCVVQTTRPDPKPSARPVSRDEWYGKPAGSAAATAAADLRAPPGPLNLAALRSKNEKDLAKLTEMKQATLFLEQLRTNACAMYPPGLDTGAARAQMAEVGLPAEDLKVAIRAGMMTFLLHVESRVSSALGQGFYTIGYRIHHMCVRICLSCRLLLMRRHHHGVCVCVCVCVVYVSIYLSIYLSSPSPSFSLLCGPTSVRAVKN